jgi:hypothetical protein
LDALFRRVCRARLLVALVGVTALLGAAPAAPVPPNIPPTPRYATVRAVLGKSHLGKEVRTICRLFGEHPVIVYTLLIWFNTEEKDTGAEDDSFYLEWKSKGLDLLVGQGKVRGIFLYNKDADGHAGYKGELPEKLTFADDPAAVERKLGKPNSRNELEGVRKVDGKPQDELWLTYDTQSYLLVFRRLRGEPYRIHSISVGLPEKK